MTLFSRCDTPPDLGRSAASRGRYGVRRSRDRRPRPLAEFIEEIGILFRYATGRDYYDRRLLVPKD